MITEKRLAEMEAQPCALDVLELVEEVRELRSRVWMQATRNVYRTFEGGVLGGVGDPLAILATQGVSAWWWRGGA